MTVINNANFEINSLNQSLEFNCPNHRMDYNNLNPTFENHSPNSEFFPTSSNKKQKTSNKSTKKIIASKLISAVAIVTVGVAAIITSPQPPPQNTEPPPIIETEISPSVKNIQVIDLYESPNELVADSPMYYYDIGFTFDLAGAYAESVNIVGESFYDYGYGEKFEQQAIDITIESDYLIQNTDGTVTAKFTAEDMHRTYQLYAILTYTEAQTTKTLKSELFVGQIPRLITSEMQPQNKMTATVTDTDVICTARFEDYLTGCFEFRPERLTVYYGDQTLSFGGEGEAQLPVEFKNGAFEFTYTFAKPQGDSVVFDAILEGDSYYNGQKMNILSETHITKEIILGTAYSAEKPYYTANLGANGLTLTSVKYQTDYEGLQDALPQILPGRTVTVWITLNGTAIANGTITADISLNEQKITDAVLSYTQSNVFAGDAETILELSFTMPSTNITSSDIKINGFTFEPEV